MAYIELTPRDLAGPRSLAEAARARSERQARLRAAELAKKERDRTEAQLRAMAREEREAEAMRLAVERARIENPAIMVRPRWRVIAEKVCAERGLRWDAVRGPCRSRPMAYARQEIMYRLVHDLGLTLLEIGSLMSSRDHTTVLHGVRAHAAREGLPVFGAHPGRSYAQREPIQPSA